MVDRFGSFCCRSSFFLFFFFPRAKCAAADCLRSNRNVSGETFKRLKEEKKKRKKRYFAGCLNPLCRCVRGLLRDSRTAPSLSLLGNTRSKAFKKNNPHKSPCIMRRAVGVLSPINSLCCNKGNPGELEGPSIPGELSGTRNADGDVALSTLQDYQTRVLFPQEHPLEVFTNGEATRPKLLPLLEESPSASILTLPDRGRTQSTAVAS